MNRLVDKIIAVYIKKRVKIPFSQTSLFIQAVNSNEKKLLNYNKSLEKTTREYFRLDEKIIFPFFSFCFSKQVMRAAYIFAYSVLLRMRDSARFSVEE